MTRSREDSSAAEACGGNTMCQAAVPDVARAKGLANHVPSARTRGVTKCGRFPK